MPPDVLAYHRNDSAVKLEGCGHRYMQALAHPNYVYELSELQSTGRNDHVQIHLFWDRCLQLDSTRYEKALLQGIIYRISSANALSLSCLRNHPDH